MTNDFRKPRIGLIVDHPTRDLAGLVLVAHHLVNRGFDAYLVPMYQQGIDVPLLGLDALVINFARPVNLEMVRQYKELGLDVFVLDTEGGVLSNEGRASPSAIANYVKTSGFADLLNGYFFWGSCLKAAFVDAEVLQEDRLFLTGCPRFDYYAGNLREMEPSARTGHVLVNTNYPMANPRFVSGNADDRAALHAIGFADDYIDQLLAENQRIMAEIVALVDRLATDLPEQEFVVRPHPFEDEHYYRRRFADSPNIVVDGDGPVLGALRGAKVLVHLNCGTAIEALMSDVPPIAPDWLNSAFMRSHVELPTRASIGVESYSELIVLLREPEQLRGDLQQLYCKIAEPYFHFNDGRSAERVADQLLASVRARPTADKRSFAVALRGSHPRPTLSQLIQGLFGNFVGSAAVRDLRARRSVARRGKAFGHREVQIMLDRLSTVLGGAAAMATPARHPLTRLPLASIQVGSAG